MVKSKMIFNTDYRVIDADRSYRNHQTMTEMVNLTGWNYPQVPYIRFIHKYIPSVLRF